MGMLLENTFGLSLHYKLQAIILWIWKQEVNLLSQWQRNLRLHSLIEQSIAILRSKNWLNSQIRIIESFRLKSNFTKDLKVLNEKYLQLTRAASCFLFLKSKKLRNSTTLWWKTKNNQKKADFKEWIENIWPQQLNLKTKILWEVNQKVQNEIITFRIVVRKQFETTGIKMLKLKNRSRTCLNMSKIILIL